MKKTIIFLLSCSLALLSCEKDGNCKEKQAIELQKLNDRYQEQLSNPNRNEDQIREIMARYEKDKQAILQKCR